MGGRGWASAQQGLQCCQRFETTGNPADLARGIGLLQAGLAASSDPGEQALILGNLGTALWRHFELTGAGAVLDESIRARTMALSSGRLGAEDFVKWTHDLRDGLRARYDRSNRPADLDAAILVGQQVRELPPWSRPPAGLWAGWLSEYAADLEDRAQLRVPADGASADGASSDQAALDDIETAVRLRREAISIAPAGYPDQPGLRSNLGNALTLRAVLAGPGQPQLAGQDLAEAVGLHREAVRLALATHPYLVRLHGNFCRALAEQAARTRDRALLDEAVTAARRASERARPGEEASVARVLLVKCLAQRAKDAADPASLRELIDALEDPASPPAGADEAAERRLAAADAWTEHYWVSGDRASLTQAVEHARAVLDGPGGPVDRDTVYRGTVYGDTVYRDTVYRDTARFTLSTVLRYRFEYVGDPADLAEATELARAALAAAAADDPGHRASCLGHLGVCLVLAAGPDAGRLAEGIGLIRQAISGWPAGDAAALSLRTDLAIALRTRYEETHDLADLDEAIELGRTIAAAPVRRADPARHGNDLARLGIAEQVRYRHTGQAADLDHAIEHGRAGIGLIPAGDPLRASYLSSLGLALQLRYGERGQAADLDEAVQAGDAAVAAIPASDPYRWMALSNAGLAYRLRSELTGGEADLRAAIELGRASVTAAGADQAALPGARSNLSRALFVRWQRHRDAADLRDAVAGLRTVARLAGAPRQGRAHRGRLVGRLRHRRG